GYGYQLLGLRGQCPVGENQVTEVRERIVDFRRKLLAAGTKAGSGLGKDFSRHDDSPGFVVAYRPAARVALEAATFTKDCPSPALQGCSGFSKGSRLQLSPRFLRCKR